MEQEENALFKLIHVGKPQQNYETGSYHINCYFQPWSIKQNCPINDDILTHSINSAFAGELACGTLWTDKNIKTKKDSICSTEYQSIHIDPSRLYAKHLKAVIDINSLLPKGFWHKHGNTWVACIEYNKKIIIIPYFELIRTIFYQTSYRLTNFLLSQTPYNQLCRPLSSPSADNSFTARYCIATTNLTAPEARLLGNILFDPCIKYIFNIMQSYWRTNASENDLINSVKTDSLIIGDFKGMAFHAKGHNFICDGIGYFWVESLEITKQIFCFEKLLFYPLIYSSKKTALDHINVSHLPVCSDVFKSLNRHYRPPELVRCISKTGTAKHSRVPFFENIRQERHAINRAGKLPLVVRRSAWAVAAPDNYQYLTDEMMDMLKFKAIKTPRKTPQYTDEFKRIISEFASHHYSVSYLTLNNQSQVFGKGLSVMPVEKYSPIPNSMYNGLIRPFPLAQVHLHETFFCIAQPFPQINPELTILVIKQNLSQPTDSEFNTMLNQIIPVRNTNDFLAFYKKIKYISRLQTASNTALLVIPVPTQIITIAFCLTVADNVVSRFRKRIQFFIATFLRFPQGVSKTQMTHIIKLSRNICKTPDPLLLTYIARLWSNYRYTTKP